MPDPKTDATALVGLLAEPERLRVVAAVVLGAVTPQQVADVTGLDQRSVAAALKRLHRGGLVSIVDGELRLDVAVFKETARAAAPEPDEDDHGVSDPGVAAVLRTFVRDGRLASIPVPRAKRRIVLEHIAAGFEPGVRYSERDVDAALRAWHDDYAALRRYLVDEDLLGRAEGLYWRTGGWVDPA
jgi:hypothetical protein